MDEESGDHQLPTLAVFEDTEPSNRMDVSDEDTTERHKKHKKDKKDKKDKKEKKEKKARSKRRAKDNVDESESENEEDRKVSQGVEFFGLLDKQEMEYFKQTESTLSANAFASTEERLGFISSVFEEMKSKELKLCTDQICSKLVERLVANANKEQLIQLFKAFQGHFAQLASDKYASHCLESLLIASAGFIEQDLSSRPGLNDEQIDSYVLSIALELQQPLGDGTLPIFTLSKNKYASHVVRTELLVLGGKEIRDLRSRRSKAARKMILLDENQSGDNLKAHMVPSSFADSLQQLLNAFVSAFQGDTEAARQVAIDSVSSPLASLVVQLEGKNNSFAKLVFSGETSAIMEHLLSDPIGSHFLQAVVEYCPTKFVTRLYEAHMKERIGKLAQRDYGAFVVQALLRKFKMPELGQVIDELLNSTSFDVIPPSMIRCLLESNYKKEDISKKIIERFDLDSKSVFDSILPLNEMEIPSKTTALQLSLLVQELNNYSPVFRKYTIESLLKLDGTQIHKLAKDPMYSRILENCMDPKLDIVQRRKLLGILSDGGEGNSFANLASSSSGSFIVDRCWDFTYRLKHFREMIAENLAANADAVKDSIYGRLVWRNWNMEKYIRRRHEWWVIVKEREDALAQEIGDESHKKRHAARPLTKSDRRRGGFEPYSKRR